MKLEFEGLDGYVAQLEKMDTDVKQGKEAAVMAGAEVAKSFIEGRTRVRTGKLKKSVRISEYENDEVFVYIDQQGPGFYGYFHEFGTSRMPARPFMGPAFIQSMPFVERAMASSLAFRLGLVV